MCALSPRRGRRNYPQAQGCTIASKSEGLKARRAIANQEERQQKRSFKEELIAQLLAHDIEGDECCIWA